MATKLVSLACYSGSAVFGKGLSLIALPFLAHHIPPSELAKLDMMASIVEPLGIVAMFALGETLFRFSNQSASASKSLIDELFGIAIAGFVILTLITQCLMAPQLGNVPNTPGQFAIHATILTACLGVFIELPLAYLRLSEKPFRFLLFVAGRSIGQVAVVVLALKLGAGVDGILIGNAILDLCVVALLCLTLPHGMRPTLNLAALGRFLSYGLPLVLGGFAMFGLGSFDRWFLAGTVDPQAIGVYAIATKVALGLSLAIMPFSLWWYPRRYRVLAQLNGLELTASVWSIGVVVFGTAAVLTAAIGVTFIQLMFPQPYQDAIRLLPLLIVIALLQESASLSNGISYARATSWNVLAVNLLGAAMAVALYFVLIPQFGIDGAIYATLAAQSFRLCAFLAAKQNSRRLPVPLWAGCAFLAGCSAIIFQLCHPEQRDTLVLLSGLALALGSAGMLGRSAFHQKKLAAAL